MTKAKACVAMLLLTSCLAGTATGQGGTYSWGSIYEVSESGQALASLLDGLRVPEFWLKSRHTAWFSGQDNNPQAKYGISTHCSTFAAAVAERLGVYLPRPPNNKQILLSNAQQKWLLGEGAAAGWRQVEDPAEAQAAANAGCLGLISYANPDPSKPGHIAVVRPFAQPSLQALQQKGVQEAQAGSVNSPSIPASQGFSASHWRAAKYFVFDRPAPAPLPQALTWRPRPSCSSSSSGGGRSSRSSSGGSSGAPVRYLVDSSPSGRLNAFRVGFTAGEGLPTWQLGSAAVPEAGTAFNLTWYQYSLPTKPTQEPFSSSAAGSASLRLTPSGALLLGEASVEALAEGGTPTGSCRLAPVAASRLSKQKGDITGLWYAAQDSLAFGLFITRASSTQLRGFLLGYDYSSNEGGTQLPRQSAWLSFQAPLDPESQDWGAGGVGLSLNTTQAVLSRCTYSSAAGAQSCVPVGGPALFRLQGAWAELEGVPGASGPLELQKASVVL